MANARELAHLFYTHKIVQNRENVHLVDYYLEIVQTAGASDLSVEFVLPVDPDAADSVSTMLSERGVLIENYAVLVPGSAHRYKCWPVERFAALAHKIASQFHLSIVATGTVAEKTLVESLANLANVPLINLAGLTNLSQLVALLKAARVVVSNDTGPGHIAAALGTPLVLIFGRSNPARVAPYGGKNSIVAAEPNARGLQLNSKDPAHDITAVTVEQVYQKVCDQLKD
jgi:ADP-heptose:LPS heptosyltransferase